MRPTIPDEARLRRYNLIDMKKLIKKTLKLEKPSLVQDEFYFEWADDGKESTAEEIRIDEPNK